MSTQSAALGEAINLDNSYAIGGSFVNIIKSKMIHTLEIFQVPVQVKHYLQF